MAARPFDADGAAAGAHVPQQFAGAGGQARQGHGAHVALGQLTVVAIGVVRQARGEGQAGLTGLAQDLDGHQVERRRLCQRPGLGAAGDASLRRTAQMLQHLQLAGAKALVHQQGGQGGGAMTVVAQDQQARAGMQVAHHPGQGPRHHRQQRDLLQGPAQAGSGQGIGGRRRQHLQFVGRQLAREARANAEQHGIATGQHADRGAAAVQHGGEGEGLRPGLADGADAGWQQRQLAWTADDDLRLQ